MLKAVITYLNLKLGLLNYFDLTRCLSELKVNNEGLTSPKEYISNGNWDNIDFDSKDGVSYWRLRDEITTSPIESVYKAGKRVEVTIPLKLVFSVPRRKLTEDDAYAFDRIRQTITKQFNIDDGDLKNTLGCEKVEISSPTANGDAKEVWDGETENTGTHEPNYDVVFGSVDIDVKLIYKGTCLPTECDDVDSDILHSFDFCNAAVRDRLTAAQITCLEDALCGVCTDATVENSDASYSTTVASGGTLVVPDTDISVNSTLVVEQPSTIANDLVLRYETAGLVPFNLLSGEMVVDDPVAASSLSIGIYTDVGLTTPASSIELGNTYYINVVPSNITPTSYTLYISNQFRGIDPITQAGATFTWVADIVCVALNVAVSATDGSGYAFNKTTIASTVGVLPDCNLIVNSSSTFTPATDGVKLTNQSDLSGNGNDATQSVVARQPLNDTSGINGLHSVQFGATTATHLESLFSIGASNTTTFVFDVNTMADKSIFWIGATYNDGGTPYMGVGIKPNGNISLYERSVGFNTIANITLTTATTYLCQVRRTATYVEIWINGEVIFARSTADAGNRSTGIFFGSGFNGSFDGRIGHFEQVNRFISETERIAQQDELFQTWGI